MSDAREIETISKAFHTIEGDGIDVLRAVPGQGYENVGPFIFLDHFGPIAWKPGEAKGASSHPHAGIETMTLLLEGRMRHKDSLGNMSTMAPGDVQWMRAGRGIVHDEQPDTSAMAPGERTHGIQLWLNLPAGGKHVPPRYRHVIASEIPLLPVPDGVNRLRLVAGQVGDMRGPVDTGGSPFVVHASLARTGPVSLAVGAVKEIAVYVMLGTVRIGAGGRQVAAGQLARLAAGDRIDLVAERGTELLVFGGDPLDAPILRYGPFVMNTIDELRGAIADFQAGRMGSTAA
jgi:redox-sensitive bicupin YhaK (pirin superfamily)